MSKDTLCGKRVHARMAFELARRLEVHREAKDHTYTMVGERTGLTRNKIWRIEHPFAKTNSRRYGTPSNTRDISAVLSYLGLDWSDLGEPRHPATFSEIDAQLRRLPELDENSAKLLSNVLMTTYQGLRQMAREQEVEVV